MRRGAGPFADGVRAAGIGHVVERLAELDQAIDKMLDHLEMRVVVERAVNDEEIALQTLRVVDRRGALVAVTVASCCTGSQTILSARMAWWRSLRPKPRPTRIRRGRRCARRSRTRRIDILNQKIDVLVAAAEALPD